MEVPTQQNSNLDTEISSTLSAKTLASVLSVVNAGKGVAITGWENHDGGSDVYGKIQFLYLDGTIGSLEITNTTIQLNRFDGSAWSNIWTK